VLIKAQSYRFGLDETFHSAIFLIWQPESYTCRFVTLVKQTALNFLNHPITPLIPLKGTY